MSTQRLAGLYGIKESGEILEFVGAFTTTTADVTADKKVSLAELFKYLGLWPVIAPAVDNYQGAVKEATDYDEGERAELKAIFSRALKLPNPITEDLFEEGADLGLHMIHFIAKVKAAKAEKAVVL
jgi:hypothetical protein